MKRFLSWVVLIPCWFAAHAVFRLAVRIAFWVLNAAAGKGRGFFVGILTFFGGAGLGFGITSFLLIAAAYLSVKASQLVEHSQNGRRYLVFGIILAVIYALVALSLVLLFAPDSNRLFALVLCVAMILYSIALIFVGRSVVAEDGPPVSRKERLEQELEKLRAQEQKDNLDF